MKSSSINIRRRLRENKSGILIGLETNILYGSTKMEKDTTSPSLSEARMYIPGPPTFGRTGWRGHQPVCEKRKQHVDEHNEQAERCNEYNVQGPGIVGKGTYPMRGVNGATSRP